MKGYLLFVTLLCVSCTVVSQENTKPAVFNIMLEDEMVGTLEAWRDQEGEFTVYRLHSNITKEVLHVKHFVYDLIVKYKDNTLWHSDYRLYINEKLEKSAVLNRIGDKLVAVKNGKPKKKKKSIDPIPFSSVLLYFKEPKGIRNTYSEAKLSLRTLGLHPNNRNAYVLDKNKGDYYYENGLLQRVSVRDLAHVELIRQ